ncbi:MAG TPA: PDZ domain-containing protein [Planctomycetota bacterium]|nr:PDZ domain-containing protein [Planctomycetota bacterium]
MDDKRTVRHVLSVPRPGQHTLHVTTTVGGLEGRKDVTLALPVWAPGSYKVRDFSKGFLELQARDPASGRALVAEKTRKNAWRVTLDGARSVEVASKVYGFELSVRTNHVDDRHAFVNGTNTFLHVEGELDRPVELEVQPPEGWEVACALERVPAPGFHYRAKDYDELADSPIEIAKFDRFTFEHAGVPHEIVISGGGNRPSRSFTDDIKKIVATEVALWGELPCPRYSFIVHLFQRGQGGLEHKNSTAVQYPRTRLRKKKDYERFLSLVAHEYFHLWNGKRLRPKPLGPFDYEREVYTGALWLVEGVTAYYDELILARAALMQGERYLELQADRLRALMDTPGRTRQSLSEASFDAWIKYYQRDENAPNSQVSYYEKGQLVAMILDLEIRSKTGSRRSLDDIVRELWRRYGSQDKGYEEKDLEPLFSEVAGFDLRPFFQAYIHGTEEPDWQRSVGLAGLELKPSKRKKDDPLPARLGVMTDRREGGRIELASVLEGSPAFEGGLSAKDEIIAIEGRKVTADQFDDRLQDFAPGDKVRFTIFRDDDLREVTVTLGDGSKTIGRLVKRKDASLDERALYEAWLGRPWDEKEDEEPAL